MGSAGQASGLTKAVGKRSVGQRTPSGSTGAIVGVDTIYHTASGLRSEGQYVNN